MRLSAAMVGDLQKEMEREIRRSEMAVTAAMGRGGGNLKTTLRGDTVRAGLGARLSKSWRSQKYPRRGASLNAAALVYSKAPLIHAAFNDGTVIRSPDGFFLAIPTLAAGRLARGKRPTPGEWEQRHGIRLRFVYRRTGPSLLVAEGARINKAGRAVKSRAKTGRNQVTAPIFILMPSVKMPKLYDVDRRALEELARIPGYIADEFDRLDARDSV